jgi:hypothetical protein
MRAFARIPSSQHPAPRPCSWPHLMGIRLCGPAARLVDEPTHRTTISFIISPFSGAACSPNPPATALPVPLPVLRCPVIAARPSSSRFRQSTVVAVACCPRLR